MLVLFDFTLNASWSVTSWATDPICTARAAQHAKHGPDDVDYHVCLESSTLISDPAQLRRPGRFASGFAWCVMSRKRQADALIDSPPVSKNSKQDGASEADKQTYRTVKFKQCTAQVRPATDGWLFADPPFLIVPAAFDVSKGVKASSKQTIKKGDLDMIYFRPFLNSSTATSLYSWCLAELPWFKVQYKARGMEINTPRSPHFLLSF